MNKQTKDYLSSIEIITQQCECCHRWVNQEELVWDLEQDRLVCRQCYSEVRK